MFEIKTIESDKYEPVEGTNCVKHVGMITGQEAFDQLYEHLERVGLLPDEYFSPAALSDLSGDLPNFSEAICHTNWGGSEGIYIDIFLRYREDGSWKQFPFATGKTLDASGDAFLKMSRIAAECSMMLNGRGCKVRVSENAYENNPLTQEVKPSLTQQIQSANTRASASQSGPNEKGKLEDLFRTCSIEPI